MSRILIKLDDDGLHATVTIEPGWLGRLFGGRVKHGKITYYTKAQLPSRPGWAWPNTGRCVEDRIVRALELQDVNVEKSPELPEARIYHSNLDAGM